MATVATRRPQAIPVSSAPPSPPGIPGALTVRADSGQHSSALAEGASCE